MKVHYCATSDGANIMCVCHIGHDHTEAEMEER